MKLSAFIRRDRASIVREWEAFAATLLPAAGSMNSLALRDHIEEILEAIAADLEHPQGAEEQSRKSRGKGEAHRMQAVGKAHAAARIDDGFNLSQLVAEYRALRATVLRLYSKRATHGLTRPEELEEMTRFNEALDEVLAESTNRYMALMNRTRDQFLAILGHDLRNPLGAILTSATLMTARGAGDQNTHAASRILRSARRMQRMVNDLLDLTRTRLGSGIPVSPRPMDLGALCRDVVGELQAFHPDRIVELRRTGDLHGTWDQDRLAQVLSNLIGNALQHGERSGVIGVVARVEGERIVLEVHNTGRAIPRALLGIIFEPMVRDSTGSFEDGSSMGLGLHIAREIVLAHGGALSVESTRLAGTTFTVRLPRHVVPTSSPREPLTRPDAPDSTGSTPADGPSLH